MVRTEEGYPHGHFTRSLCRALAQNAEPDIRGAWHLVFFAFVVHVFSAWLNQFTFIGFPLGYYLAVQGSLAIFVALIFVQNWAQDEIDEEFNQDD